MICMDCERRQPEEREGKQVKPESWIGSNAEIERKRKEEIKREKKKREIYTKSEKKDANSETTEKG